MWRHKALYSNTAYYLGLAALVNLLLNGMAFAYAPYIIALYLVGSLTITVGYHRLFCHASFKTPKFVHWCFATTGILFQYSSPLQWAVTHATHHKKSDTDGDPHYGKPTALFVRGYRDVPLDVLKAKRLLRQGRFHRVIDQYYMILYAVMVLPLVVLFPSFMLYAYLPALGLLHLAGSLHTTFSHWNDKPRDLAFMEFIIPAGGEWLHKFHHDHPRASSFRSKWWHFDLGAIVISLIMTK